jgi:hypothetical protein
MSGFEKFLGVLGLFALAHCGSGDAHCDFQAKGQARCQERLGTVAAFAFKQTCSASLGDSGDGPCPRENIVAGCDIGTQGDGSHVTDWYYSPKTMSDVVSACMSDQGTLLPRP